MSDPILVLNAGSSSVKFELFDVVDAALQRRFKGKVDGIGTRPKLKAKAADGAILINTNYEAAEMADIGAALDALRAWLTDALGGERLAAVGHRVVHGGPEFSSPVVIDHDVVATLEAYVPLAPLHQPSNLAPIKRLLDQQPDLVQVACFDTAFHRDHGALADRFAVPEWLYEEGVRRYGFHGLSYEYIAQTLTTTAPDLAQGKVVVAHLGSGASLCAIKAGRSVDSTMGFTALDGLPMGTRPGQLDAGVILYLLEEKGMSGPEIQHLLYHESGLKGLSGVSNDMRDLLASDAPGAQLAFDYFVYRIAKETAALASVLGGLDGLVFTAGIGEHGPEVRAAVCERLSWLALTLDPEANDRHASVISAPGSAIQALVISTDEEFMIATHTLRLMTDR
ncbi:MAG: acetate/propionate family kinase [Alphaproteobacteria bacterium]|nr:acetate/propionate family kinase [Alphaproteobacteria bacterium]